MENFTTHWVAIATPALLLGVVVAVCVVRFLRRRRNQFSVSQVRSRFFLATLRDGQNATRWPAVPHLRFSRRTQDFPSRKRRWGWRSMADLGGLGGRGTSQPHAN